MDNNDLTMLFRTAFTRQRTLWDTEVIDFVYWCKYRDQLLYEIKTRVDKIPLISVDDEYFGSYVQIGTMDQKKGCKVYIFRMYLPLIIRRLMLSQDIMVVGDSGTMRLAVGIIPTTFVELAGYCLDCPGTGKKTGVEGIAMKFLGINLAEIKSSKLNKMKRPRQRLNNDRCMGTICKAEGAVGRSTYSYAGLDNWVYLMGGIRLMDLVSMIKIKNFQKTSNQPRTLYMMRVVQNNPISHMEIDQSKVDRMVNFESRKDQMYNTVAKEVMDVKIQCVVMDEVSALKQHHSNMQILASATYGEKENCNDLLDLLKLKEKRGLYGGGNKNHAQGYILGEITTDDFDMTAEGARRILEQEGTDALKAKPNYPFSPGSSTPKSVVNEDRRGRYATATKITPEENVMNEEDRVSIRDVEELEDIEMVQEMIHWDLNI